MKDARERKGVSLRAIADVTRISVAVLESLERNDISRLPGGIFTRGFVRAYASQVGLDQEATVDDFLRQFPDASVTVGHPPSTRLEDAERFEGDRRAASLGLKLVLISLPLAALVAYFSVTGWSWPRAIAGKLSPPVADVAAPPAAAPEVLAGALRLSIEVTASRGCVISSAVDGGAVADMTLEAGGRRIFEVGHDLQLTVSDASAIDVTINGTPVRPLGRPGEPATVRLTLDNYREHLDVR